MPAWVPRSTHDRRVLVKDFSRCCWGSRERLDERGRGTWSWDSPVECVSRLDGGCAGSRGGGGIGDETKGGARWAPPFRGDSRQALAPTGALRGTTGRQ